MLRATSKLILCAALACSVMPVNSQSDTNTVSLGESLKLIRDFHPIARQAQLIQQEGNAYVQYARGAFDPKIYLEQRNKYYDGKNYYDERGVGLQIPTWFGLTLNAGNESNAGAFINPEDITPSGGLSYAGATMPLLRNLITDARRTQLQRAKIFETRSGFMKNTVLNELAANVVSDYLRWYFAAQELALYNQAVAMSTDRLRAVREEFIAGAKPISDTIETAAQLGSFLLSQQEAQIEYAKAKLMFSAHLWNSDGLPVEPLPGVLPAFSGLDFLDSFVAAFPDTAVVENILELQPELGNMSFFQKELELEKRFKKQQLLPDLSLKYNLLSPGFMNFTGPSITALNNYNFGLKFSTSLFLRKERGEYRLADYKWQGQGLKVAWKTRESTQKVRAAYVKVLTYRDMLGQMKGLVDNFQTLYENEKIRFESGDATVFLVNTRETKLIETRIKQLSYFEKNLLSQTEYLEKAGILWQILR